MPVANTHPQTLPGSLLPLIALKVPAEKRVSFLMKVLVLLLSEYLCRRKSFFLRSKNSKILNDQSIMFSNQKGLVREYQNICKKKTHKSTPLLIAKLWSGQKAMAKAQELFLIDNQTETKKQKNPILTLLSTKKPEGDQFLQSSSIHRSKKRWIY